MFGIRPTFDNELERVHVDTRLLEVYFRDAIDELFKVGAPDGKYQSLHVDVTSRQSTSDRIEWRINMPPNSSKLYVSLGVLIHQANEMMQLFVDLGTLLPQEFTISIWLLEGNEAPIIGSVDK